MTLCEVRMLGFPFLQCDPQPEAINTAGDQGQKPPLDPVPKQLHGVAIKGEAMPVDHCVSDLPTVNHTAGPGIADPECEECNDAAQQIPADQLQQTSVKIRFVHGNIPFLIKSRFSTLIASNHNIKQTKVQD